MTRLADGALIGAVDTLIADRLVVRSGRIVADGEPETLLDAVPPVVRVAGRTNVEALRTHVRERRLFESDAGRRGFLVDGTAPETVAGIGDSVRIDDSTWTDLFNYFVHIVPSV